MTEACVELLMSPFVPATNEMKLFLSLISVSLAIATFLLMRMDITVNKKIIFVYLHIILVMFPVVLYATHMTCGYLCFSCYSNPLKLVALVLPTTLIFGIITSLIVVPLVLIRINGSRRLTINWVNNLTKKYSKHLKIINPMIYVIDKPNPIAFSFKTFKSAIFISVGMLELFNKKELEAVILHELMHIKRTSSMLKFSNIMLSFFSPISMLSRFEHSPNYEEKLADKFAVNMQGSKKHLISAKNKLKQFIKI